VEEAVASGIEHVVIITGQGKRAIEDHFDNHFELEARLGAAERHEDLAAVRGPTELARFTYVRQGQPKGNGHAVLCARQVVGNEPFAMIWGDDIVDSKQPCLREMIDTYHRHGGAVAAVMRVAPEDASKYGVIDAEPIEERVYRIRSIVEKPPRGQAPSNLATVHAWILPPRVFELLADTPAGKDDEIWLVDAIVRLIEEQPVFALEIDGRRYDAGNKLEFLQATVDFALRRPDLGPGLRRYLQETLSVAP
jgi:UTP--glucose-1-phosphate uridylyltransferase